MSADRMVARMMGATQRRIQNMLLRGTVALVNAATRLQTLQINGLAGETLEGIEHFEPYGFTSRAGAGAEHITVFIDGDRSHGVTIVVADRAARPTDLQEGDAAMYDRRGQRVHFTATGIVIDGAGLPVNFVNTPSIKHDGVDIGNTHAHGGVQPGSSNTSTPNP